MTDTYVLSCHAGYRCRRSGACCTAGWPIPIEADRVALLEEAVRAGTLGPLESAAPAVLYRTGPGAGDPTVLGVRGGACVFHDTSGDRQCAVHHHLGHDALPLACRQFPRVVVRDPRGVSVTLSAFCPTVADALTERRSTRIEVNATGFPPDGEYVGLDVREALPPALRPDMLMTWNGWWHFEQRVVAHLSASIDPADAVDQLRAIVERIRVWSPGERGLEDAIDAAFADSPTPSSDRLGSPPPESVAAAVCAAVPDAHRQSAYEALARQTRPPAPGVHVRFLAAHAFGSWAAHLGQDLRTWLRSVETAHVLAATGVDIRDVDLVVRHLADPFALAQIWNRVE